MNIRTTDPISIIMLFARLALGALFIVAGSAKVGHADIFAAQITAFHLVPRLLIAPIALLMPFGEVLLGAYLVIGLYVRVAATIAMIQLLIFAIAIAAAVSHGLSLSCGCFGPHDTTVTSWNEVGRDLLFAAVAAIVAWQPSRFLALDNRIGKNQ